MACEEKNANNNDGCEGLIGFHYYLSVRFTRFDFKQAAVHLIQNQ